MLPTRVVIIPMTAATRLRLTEQVCYLVITPICGHAAAAHGAGMLPSYHPHDCGHAAAAHGAGERGGV